MVLLLGAAALLIMSQKKNGAVKGDGVIQSSQVTSYVEPWLPYPFTVFNGEGQRTAANNIEVIRQFQVATNPRYTPNATTKCNIFSWDYTCAMGCEIPHWVDIFRNKAAVGKGSEMNANQTSDWLNAVGASHGWYGTTEYEARSRALAGFPSLVTWKNPNGIGHQAVIFPNSDRNETYIAQAGARNFENEPRSRGFGHIENLQFWTHQ